MRRIGWQLKSEIAVDVRFMGTCAEVALPDPAHAGKSTVTYRIIAVIRGQQFSAFCRSAPERRPCLLQDAAEADRAHFAGKARCVVGFDREAA